MCIKWWRRRILHLFIERMFQLKKQQMTIWEVIRVCGCLYNLWLNHISTMLFQVLAEHLWMKRFEYVRREAQHELIHG